ncbi:MAG: class I adenylate-forming enzyme family protein [Myxococcota bacterium]
MSALRLLPNAELDRQVAFGEAGNKTVRELLSDAGRIAAALPEATPGSHVLLVIDRDRYAMAVSFLGAIAAGHAVALPPNSRRDSVLAVHDREETVATIHDSDAGMHFRFEKLLEAGAGAPPLPPDFSVSDLDAPILATVFTSGSTGPMAAWPKSPGALLGEGRVLGDLFDVSAEERIVGTVAPGHIYGLLFTVLLPLLRGAAFCRDTPLHAEAVARAVSTFDATVLVTVPVQLRALNGLSSEAFPNLKRVFSSTGPLPADISDAFRARHGLSVTEIFGSTETGGIAYRERAGESPGGDEWWTPLTSVRVSGGADGRLRVDSPFVDRSGFETEDLVRIEEDGRFTHLGRADGVVKIGGRRVQVGEVEECIRQHESVIDAAVVAVPASGARGHQLLAAIVPETASTDEIRKALLKRFEPSCLPRRMLRVSALPREENGKLLRARLLRLFGLRADGHAENWKMDWRPAVRSRDGEAERVEVEVDLPDDYAWFEGHFDDYAVLAGAAQLKELILPAVESAFPDLGRLESMNRVKFLERIVPGAALRITLVHEDSSARVQFRIDERDGATCSAGHLIFAGPDA